jgi:flagellar basal body rod protein FlgC
MSEFDLLSVAADGMGVQRTLLDVAARNVAAAQVSTPQHPYPRLVARFAAAEPAGSSDPGGPGGLGDLGRLAEARGVGDFAKGIGAGDPSDAFLDAASGEDEDEDDGAARTRFAGTVRSGEAADALTEMIAVLDAQRAYEANASMFDVGKKLAERTLDVGRG